MPISILSGLLAGFVGKKLFDGIWGAFDEEEPPELELGKRGAQPRTRRKLAAALGVEPWELVEDVQGDDRDE